ncbi:DUF6192 family protein [Kitasatospora sp. NBC_01560]|uniref:DUF6192 family protein n=1 Tax=Kitasatospora sp. NBC_01560 TaxID=2975965 RepID=UPI00386E24CC
MAQVEPEAKVRAVEELTRDDQVAAAVAPSFLCRPEVVARVAPADKVKVVQELTRDDHVAAEVTTGLLRRPDVAARAMADDVARHQVNHAQVERGRQAREHFEQTNPLAPVIRQIDRSVEFLDLVTACHAFVAAVGRGVPRWLSRAAGPSAIPRCRLFRSGSCPARPAGVVPWGWLVARLPGRPAGSCACSGARAPGRCCAAVPARRPFAAAPPSGPPAARRSVAPLPGRGRRGHPGRSARGGRPVARSAAALPAGPARCPPAARRGPVACPLSVVPVRPVTVPAADLPAPRRPVRRPACRSGLRTRWRCVAARCCPGVPARRVAHPGPRQARRGARTGTSPPAR